MSIYCEFQTKPDVVSHSVGTYAVASVPRIGEDVIVKHDDGKRGPQLTRFTVVNVEYNLNRGGIITVLLGSPRRA